MVDAPGVRELKVEHGFQAHDGKLAASWTEDLTADSTRYRRGITLEELNRMAGEVPLNFSASSFRDTVELPLRRHLRRIIKLSDKLNQDNLLPELRCHLPVFVLGMCAAKFGTWLSCVSTKRFVACLSPPHLPLSALSPAERRAISAAKTKKEREDVPGKYRDCKNCFTKDGKNLVKTKTLKALLQFSTNADRILEFLGASPSQAQTNAAMFILGPFLFGPENRRLVGCKVTEESTVERLPKHGVGGFGSVLVNERSAVQEAFYTPHS